MTGFLDDIVAVTEGAPLKSQDVPEWHKTIYWRPPSLAKRERIIREANGSDSRACAKALMLLALDEHGQLLFEDKTEVMAQIESKLDGAVVARVAQRMLGRGEEQAGGNPSSATTT